MTKALYLLALCVLGGAVGYLFSLLIPSPIGYLISLIAGLLIGHYGAKLGYKYNLL